MKAQSGNALFLILIAVALFAALSYAVTQSGRGEKGITGEKNILSVGQIFQYSAQIQSAITRMRLVNGCTENQISFASSHDPTYANASAPPDGSCHVFNPAGGGVTFSDPPIDTRDPTVTGLTPGSGNYGFSGGGVVTGLGTAAHELLMWSLLTKEACQAINAKVEAVMAEDSFGDGLIGTRFTGTYGSVTYVLGDNAYAPNQATGCFSRAAYNQYIYYHVLITR